MTMYNQEPTHYIDSQDANAPDILGEYLFHYLERSRKQPPLFLCIGSDRVTGDSLGPFIGTQLRKRFKGMIPVYGTLDSPIHALNLDDSIEYIKRHHSNHTIIAIDASLGTKHHQGFISIGKGSLLPGAGVNKKLNAVGDIYITGIINTSGRFAHLALQTTRLSTVVHLADCIQDGILNACETYTLLLNPAAGVTLEANR